MYINNNIKTHRSAYYLPYFIEKANPYDFSFSQPGKQI